MYGRSLFNAHRTSFFPPFYILPKRTKKILTKRLIYSNILPLFLQAVVITVSVHIFPIHPIFFFSLNAKAHATP